MAEPAPGSQLGRYRIEAIAGQGEMGVFYRATQLALEGQDRPARDRGRLTVLAATAFRLVMFPCGR